VWEVLRTGVSGVREGMEGRDARREAMEGGRGSEGGWREVGWREGGCEGRDAREGKRWRKEIPDCCIIHVVDSEAFFALL
jgi:hypothetical protein